jgi:hypothetical protein
MQRMGPSKVELLVVTFELLERMTWVSLLLKA